MTRSRLLGIAHLAVLWSFGVAKPLLDVLADEPAFFVARGHEATDVITLAVLVLAAPPLLALALEAAVGRFSEAGASALHLLLVALAAAAIALQLLPSAGPAGLILALSVALGALGAASYRARDEVRSFLNVLAPAPLLFALLFVFASPASQIVIPTKVKDAAAERIGSDAPVVMIVFDEFPLATLLTPDGSLDTERFPNFARLARISDWYSHATTVSAGTVIAVPALVTGHRAEDSSAPTAAEHPDSIFSIVRGRYELNVEETFTKVCSGAGCNTPTDDESFGSRMRGLIGDLPTISGRQILPQSLADDLPALDQGFDDFHDATEQLDDFDRYERFLERIDARPRRLHFFHLIAPHAPWQLLPDGTRYVSNSLSEFLQPPDSQLWRDDQTIVDQFWQRHILQAGFADRLLGRLLDRLERTGALDRSLLIIAADHGAGFSAGDGRRLATETNLEGIAPVPLFVKRPGQERGTERPEHVCTTDAVRFIAGELEIEPAPEVDDCPPNRVSVHTTGETPELQEKLVHARLLELVARQAKLFGTGGFDSVYRYGPQGALIGKSVRELRVSGRTSARARLLSPLPGADPGGGTLPLVRAFIAAQIEGGDDVEPGEAVLISGGDTIAGTGSVFDVSGNVRILGMSDPALLGDERIRFFRLRGGAIEEIPR